jgi:hypothetical protein
MSCVLAVGASRPHTRPGENLCSASQTIHNSRRKYSKKRAKRPVTVLHIEMTDREKQDLAEMMLPGLVTEYGLALGLAEFRRIIGERHGRA